MTTELSTKNSKTLHLIIIAFMALVVVCLFRESVNPNKMLMASDQIAAFGSKAIMQKSWMEDGQIAQWNRGILCGMPTGDAMIGDYLYPVVFPFNYLMPVYSGLALKMVLHIFLAGLFFYLMLLKGFAFPPIIAGISAVFFMLCPEFFTNVSPGHDAKMSVIALLPLMVWILKTGLDKPDLQKTAFLGISIGLGLLTVHVQMVYFSLFLLGAFWLFNLILLVRKKNYTLAKDGSFFFWGAVFLGLSLGALQFYPSFLFIQDAHSVRGVDRGFEFATSWSMHFAEIMSLWVAEFGNWYQYYWGENPFKLNTEYIGAVATILAVLAFVFKPSKWRFFWLACAFFALLFSMGADSPGILFGDNPEDKISIYTLAYHLLPGIKKFRAIAMILYIVAFSTVFLSALSLKDIWNEEWKKFSETRLKKTKIGLLISIAVISLISFAFANRGFNFDFSNAFSPNLESKRQIWEANFEKNFLPSLLGWWTIAVIILVSIWAVICGYLKKEIAVLVIFVLGMIDLIRVDTKFIDYQSNAQYKRIPNAVADVLRKTKTDPARSMFLPDISQNVNIEAFYGLEGVNGFHDNELVRYREFRGHGGTNYLSPIFARANMGYPDPVSDGGNALDLANCKYVFYATRTGQLGVIENKNALPRLAFTNSYIVENDRNIISETINNAHFPVHKTAILEQKPNFESSDENINTQISTKWLKYTANDRIANVEINANGLLRISEVYYPAWQVFIDGKKAEIINCDLAFMAVEIPAGKHKIEMKIDSLYLKTAALFSLPGYIFLLSVLGLNLFNRKGKK